MTKIFYRILLAAMCLMSVLASCSRIETDGPDVSSEEQKKVQLIFKVAVPDDGLSSKSMADKPQISNIYVAVFGGSGFFNEWVPAEEVTQMATENYDGTESTAYLVKVSLTMNDSRLRLHFMANAPSEPPITGVSSQDYEDIVMSKVRSRLSDKDSDGYWQKIILPNGIKAKTYIDEKGEEHYLEENGHYVPTEESMNQFPELITLVRNFARIYLKNTTSDVAIEKFALAYAPAEGPVAPILSSPYTSDVWGKPVSDEEESKIYNESFLINYQDYQTSSSEDGTYPLAKAPFNYVGYSPSNLEFDTYPSGDDAMADWSENTALYMYERTAPRSGQKATRIIIKARKGSEATKYYALDIVDGKGENIPILRNFTYTITLTGIALDTGETTIADAANSTAANVSADPKTEDLTEVSDGVASIATSYIDTTIISPGTYSVMFRYLSHVTSNTEAPNDVSISVGWKNDGTFYSESDLPAGAPETAFASMPSIEKNGSSVQLYVRSGNGYSRATAAQIADASVQKWGRIYYSTVSPIDRNRERTIRVAAGTLYRDVAVHLITKKSMMVECLDKYIVEAAGAAETVRIFIPNDLTKSMFPLQFKLEPDGYSLTPRDGDNLPVASGTSITGSGKSVFYFIKTLTRQDYESLETVENGGVYYRWFDCMFKSNTAKSACTVHVQSEYFNNGSDNFFNYVKRYFTDLTFSRRAEAGEEMTFSFVMDAAHTGVAVWNDAVNIGETNKVLPRIVTLSMTGCEPAMNEDGSFRNIRISGGSGGVYTYNMPDLSSSRLQLDLVATAEDYSVTLSTSQIIPNPDLYAVSRIKKDPVPVEKTDSWTLAFNNANANGITSFNSSHDALVELNNYCSDYSQWWITTTYYGKYIGAGNNQNGIIRVKAPSGGSVKAITIKYYNDRNTQNVTWNPVGNSTKSNWTGNSNDVTITMQGSQQLDNRNVVQSINVTYSYIDYIDYVVHE